MTFNLKRCKFLFILFAGNLSAQEAELSLNISEKFFLTAPEVISSTLFPPNRFVGGKLIRARSESSFTSQMVLLPNPEALSFVVQARGSVFTYANASENSCS